MLPWRSPPPVARLARWLTAAALTVTATLGGGGKAWAEWRPQLGQRLDIQLTAPFDLTRSADIMVLELFTTSPTRLQQLRSRGGATVCYVAAGIWESWRPDAGQFPQPALGGSPLSRPGQRWRWNTEIIAETSYTCTLSRIADDLRPTVPWAGWWSC